MTALSTMLSTMLAAMLVTLLHALLLAALAPALAGVRALVAARHHAEAPPPAWQAWLDLRRLWRKGAAGPAGSSLLVRAGPAVAAGSTAVAAALVPSFSFGSAAAPGGDLVVVFGLLALARGVLAAAAHDGGPAGILASGRGMAALVASAPTLALVAMAASLLSGGSNLVGAAAAVRDGGVPAHAGGILAGAALFLLLLAEPPLPEHGFAGRARALVRVADMLRVLAVLLAVSALALPFGMAPVGAGMEAWVVGAAFAVLKLGALGMAAAALQRRQPPAGLHPVAALLALAAAVASGVQGPA